MSTTSQMAGLDARLQGLLNPLTEEETALKDELGKLEARREVIQSSLRRIQQVKYAAFPESRPKPATSAKTLVRERPRIGPEYIEGVRAFIANHPEGVTVREAMRDGLVGAEASIREAIKQLREQDKVRMAGHRGTQGNPVIWRVM